MPLLTMAAGSCIGLLGLMLGLQGCGPGGTGAATTSTAPTTTVATTTTTPPPPPRTPGMEGTAAAKFLNQQYYGFKESDASSDLGVVIHMFGNVDSFFKNIYCSTFTTNPSTRGFCSAATSMATCCFEGHATADCTLSTSLMNHEVMVNSTTNTPTTFAKRSNGMALNTTLVDDYLNRCSYLFDGAALNKYNRGCGSAATPTDCSNRNSAYLNVCPSTNKTCTTEAEEVKRGFCKGYGGFFSDIPTKKPDATCFLPGPAIDYHYQDNWKPLKSWTDTATAKQFTTSFRTMLKERLKHNDGGNKAEWNEILIDLSLMMPEVWKDPSQVITAFLYKKGDLSAKKNAEKMRDEFCTFYRFDGVNKIPIIAYDPSAKIQTKQDYFVFEAGTDAKAAFI